MNGIAVDKNRIVGEPQETNRILNPGCRKKSLVTSIFIVQILIILDKPHDGTAMLLDLWLIQPPSHGLSRMDCSVSPTQLLYSKSNDIGEITLLMTEHTYDN
jgi:hypothetical protein